LFRSEQPCRAVSAQQGARQEIRGEAVGDQPGSLFLVPQPVHQRLFAFKLSSAPAEMTEEGSRGQGRRERRRQVQADTIEARRTHALRSRTRSGAFCGSKRSTRKRLSRLVTWPSRSR